MPAFLFALVFNIAVPAQPAGVITGVVVDSTGAAVPNADVRLEMPGRTIGQLRTGSDGRFEFKAAAPGALKVVVTAPGFVETSVAVSSDAGDLRVTLQPAPFFEAVN